MPVNGVRSSWLTGRQERALRLVGSLRDVLKLTSKPKPPRPLALHHLVHHNQHDAHEQDKADLDAEVPHLVDPRIVIEDVRREDERNRRESGDGNGGQPTPQAKDQRGVDDNDEELSLVQHVQPEIWQVPKGVAQGREVRGVVEEEVDGQRDADGDEVEPPVSGVGQELGPRGAPSQMRKIGHARPRSSVVRRSRAAAGSWARRACQGERRGPPRRLASRRRSISRPRPRCHLVRRLCAKEDQPIAPKQPPADRLTAYRARARVRAGSRSGKVEKPPCARGGSLRGRRPGRSAYSLAAGRPYQSVEVPPLGRSVCPVMKDPASETR